MRVKPAGIASSTGVQKISVSQVCTGLPPHSRLPRLDVRVPSKAIGRVVSVLEGGQARKVAAVHGLSRVLAGIALVIGINLRNLLQALKFGIERLVAAGRDCAGRSSGACGGEDTAGPCRPTPTSLRLRTRSPRRIAGPRDSAR